jgi:hypothetical protein
LRSVIGYNWKDVDKKKNGYSSLKNCILYEGKWKVDGSSNFIEEKAKELEPSVGRFISHMKYCSTGGNGTLVVYCNVLARGDAKAILKKHGISEMTWDTNMNSLRIYLSNPTYIMLMAGMNPNRLIELGNLAGMDMRSEVSAYNKFSEEVLRSIQSKLESLQSQL